MNITVAFYAYLALSAALSILGVVAIVRAFTFGKPRRR